MESCVVCLVQFTTSQNDMSLVKFTDENIRSSEKIPFVYRKILRIFCECFNLPSKQNQSENEILPLFPFCIECRNLVAELCILHDQIESIQKLVQKNIAKITMKIINAEKNSENSSNSDPLENQEKRGEIKSGYRRKILQDFNPRVHLTGCQIQGQNQSQSQSQKKIHSRTTETNEINSFEITNFENESPFNEQDNHDDGNDDGIVADEIERPEDRVEDDSNAEVPESSSDSSQEKEKDSLNLNSVSLSEKTGENLMQRIRAKFNQQPHFLCVEKDLSSRLSNQTENRAHKSLEDKMRSDVIKSLGGGKFLYQNSRPFHIIENQEFFLCDTCQTRVAFPKNPRAKMYTTILKHIYREHKITQDGQVVKCDSGGKTVFRFLGKCTFEKTELGFKCGHCPKIYTKLKSMKNHLEIWHVPGKFKCSKCPHSYRTQGLLDRHRCGWNVECTQRSFEVSPGKFVYNGKRQNWDFQLIDGKFQCSSCPAVTLKRDYMLNHLRRYHDGLTTHMCDECGKIFNIEENLKCHKQTHLKKPGQVDARTQPKSPAVCPHCGKTYKGAAGLGIHMFTKHKNKDVVKTTEKPTGTSTQQENAAETEEQENSSQLKFPCEKCPRRFISAVWLKKHETIHDELVCPKCDKKFESRSQFQIHLDRHNKVHKFFCDICNRGFLQKCEVERHKVTGVHSRKEETVKSKEESLKFNPNPNSNSNSSSKAQKGKRKRKKQEESSEEEEEELEQFSSDEQVETETEMDESESDNSELTTQEAD